MWEFANLQKDGPRAYGAFAHLTRYFHEKKKFASGRQEEYVGAFITLYPSNGPRVIAGFLYAHFRYFIDLGLQKMLGVRPYYKHVYVGRATQTSRESCLTVDSKVCL